MKFQRLTTSAVLVLAALTSCIWKKTEKTNGAGQMASVGVDVSAGALGLASSGQTLSAWTLTLSCKTVLGGGVTLTRNQADSSAIPVNRTNKDCASVFSGIKIKDLDTNAEISLLDKYSVGGVIDEVNESSAAIPKQDGGEGIRVSGSDIALSEESPKIVFRIRRAITKGAVTVAAGSVTVNVQMGSSLPHPALAALGNIDGTIRFVHGACPSGQTYSLKAGGTDITDASSPYTPVAASTTLVMSCTVDAVQADGILASTSSYTQTVSFLDNIPPDTTAPTVTSVTSTKVDGSYKEGEVIEVTVTFSEPVTVTGVPQLTLKIGTTAEGVAILSKVNYTSGSPGSVLRFDYTVAATHTSSDLDYASTTALGLNDGTIMDASLNNATLTLVAPGSPGSIASDKAIVIDTTAPTLVFSSVYVSNPGVTTSPRILGTGSEPSTVTLYYDSSCATAKSDPWGNTVFASPGIEVTTPVGEKRSTVIYGRAVDVAGNVSACKGLVIYTNDPTILPVAAPESTITPLGVAAHPNVDNYPTILWDTSSAFDLQKEAEINIFEPTNWIDHFSWHNPTLTPAGRVVTKKQFDWAFSTAQEDSADVFAMLKDSVFCPVGYCIDTTPGHSVKLGSYKKELPASFASADMAGVWQGIMTEVDRVSPDCVADPCVYFSSDKMTVYQIHLNSRTWKLIAQTDYFQPILAMVFDPSTERLIIGGYFQRFWNGSWNLVPPYGTVQLVSGATLVAMNVETKAVVTIPLTLGSGVLADATGYVVVRALAVSGSGVIYAGLDVADETAGRVIRADISYPSSPVLTIVRGNLPLEFNSLSFNDLTNVLQISGYSGESTAYCRVQTDAEGFPAVCSGGSTYKVLSKGGLDYVSSYGLQKDNRGAGIYETSTVTSADVSSIRVDQFIATGGAVAVAFVKTDAGRIYAAMNQPTTIGVASYPGRMVRFDPTTDGDNVTTYAPSSDLDGGFGVSHISGNYYSGNINDMMAFSPSSDSPAKIFMAGGFSRVGRDTVAHDFAVYDEATGWDALRTAQKELVGTVRAQVVDTSSPGCTPLLPCIFVAGDITQAPSSSSVGNIPVHGVAMFQAGVWTDLNPSAGLPAGLHVTSLAIDRRVPAEPKLIVGGNILADSSYVVISRSLTDVTFTQLSTGDGELRGLAVMGQNLVVAGDFGLKIKSLEGSEVASSPETLLSLTVDDGVLPPKLYVGLSGGFIMLATVTDSVITFTDAFGTGTSPLSGDVRALAVDVSKGVVMASIRDITGINPCVCLVAGSEASNRLMEYKAEVWSSPRLMAGLATGIPVKDAPFSFHAGVPGTRNFGSPAWFDWRTTTMDPLLTSKIFDFEVRMVQPPNGDWSNGPLGAIFDFDMDKVWPAQINALTISRDQSSGCSEDFPCVYIGGRFHYVHGKMRPNFMKYMPLFKEVL